ncbi:MAG: cysteine--tRNA ligase [Verrucomicrobiae bacterium]|nr:cysteine--tRNA ligase [Verrucomicrobiae bacterium]
MPMQLFDTLSRTVTELRPRDGEVFRFYCCGPTVYGPAHIGNFRTFVLQDVFRRTLEMSGLKTFHVRNLTDVDDKTIRDSQAAGETLTDFTERWTKRFHDDCARLNMLPPHKEPSAVGHIPQQIALIETLMEKGHAYRAEDGSVYYRVSSFDQYGRLSHLDKRELRLGTAVADDEYEKDSVADFALWKARKPEDGDNWWDSPWGQGRPGWHLECSAMCREYLGETFDLHSGGVDLIFPHHENEIAQSEAATGCQMADHWFHLTHLLVDGGKMSKSLNNFYTLDQIEAAGFSGAEVRYVLISAHYRQPLNFVARDKDGNETFPALAGARHALERLAKFEAALIQQGQIADPTGYDELRGLSADERGAFGPAFDGLLNDLNTPDALGRVFSAIKEVKPESLSPEEARTQYRGFRAVIEALGLVLPEVGGEVDIPAEVRELADRRFAAKQEKDWATADAMRDQLAELGWVVKDGKDGYELEPKG